MVLQAVRESECAHAEPCCVTVLQHVTCCVHYAWLDSNACSLLSSCRENRGYSSFEDFLADLKQSKRKSIRQVRRHRPLKAAVAGGRRTWDVWTCSCDRIHT
jgi:hypothetical protein